MDGVETVFNKVERNNDVDVHPIGKLSVFSTRVRLFSHLKFLNLSKEDLKLLHWYILNNCEEIIPYLDEHKHILAQEGGDSKLRRQKDLFPLSFEKKMRELHNLDSPTDTNELYALAMGPDNRANLYAGCIVNGVKFLSVERDARRLTQNSGISVEGDHKGSSINYYGVLDAIISLSYIKDFHVVLFKCSWYDLERYKPILIDEDFTSINISRTWYNDDPYILASQGIQVFYVRDTKLGGDWRVVQKAHQLHFFDPCLLDSLDDDAIEDDILVRDEAYQQSSCTGIGSQEEPNDIGLLHREDEDPEISNVASTSSTTMDDFIYEEIDDED